MNNKLLLSGKLNGKPLLILAFYMLVLVGDIAAQETNERIDPRYDLIAHRGGVVDDSTPENSLAALEKAVERGYVRIEIDVRLSRDSILVTHHDRDLSRYFGKSDLVSDLTFAELTGLRGAMGQRVYSLEEILRACKGRLEVMIDLKIPGNDRRVHQGLIDLLEKYDLLEKAMMIGTDDSSDFYRTKIALSCTRQQLEANERRPDFDPRHYYLFSGQISAEDVSYCEKLGVAVVGVINKPYRKPRSPKEDARLAQKLKEAGVTRFQIDSVYERFFE